MLYEIKVLKAPWPAGAKVGDVVDMPAVPAWAQGKCVPAEDGATASLEYVEPPIAGDVNQLAADSEEDRARRMVEHFRAQAEDAIRRAEEVHALALAEVRAQLDAANADAAELREQLEASQAHVSKLQAQIDAAETDEGKAQAAVKDAEDQAARERTAAEAKTAKGGKK